MSENQAVLDAVAKEARAEAVEALAATMNPGSRGGPKTAEGLENSSRNSLQHGLTGSGIHLPQALRDEVVRWADVFGRRYRPFGDEAREQVEAAALAFAQYRGALAEQTRYLVRRSEDALLHWDDRRTAEAEQLARSLPRNPGLVSASLRTTFRGAEWLLKRWKALRSALEKNGDWNEEEVALAMDLLGVDKVRRPYDPAGIAAASAEDRKAIVEGQCLDLEGRLSGDHAAFEEAARLDEIEGNGYLLDKTYLKLDRYARDAYRRYEKHIAFLEAHRKALPREPREEPLPPIRLPEGVTLADRPMPPDVDRLIALMARPPRPPVAPAAAEPPPAAITAAPDDRGRELRADPAIRTAVPRPKLPLTAEQRRAVEAAFGPKRRGRR